MVSTILNLPMTETDPTGRPPHEPGAKLDNGKVRPWLLLIDFPRALEEVAKVATIGARKYSDHGWVTVPDGQGRYMDAFARHTLAVARGETFDVGANGTGCYHKAQAIWNLMASLELELRGSAE